MAADNGVVAEDFDTDPDMADVVHSETCVGRRVELVGGWPLVLALGSVARCDHPRPSPVVVDWKRRQDEQQTDLLKLGHPAVDWTL